MSPSLQPPGRLSRVVARKVLVLAPHYDDEVLGCGGLVAELVEAGAEVRVLFLTDGGGQGETDRKAYSRRRRRESARAARVLGVKGTEHLGLPDGAVTGALRALVQAIRERLSSHRPDLVLVPSPLESSADHRASFAALGEVLSPLRGGDPLHTALRSLRVLVYEVNHPGYPDLLVDVSRQVTKIEEAMACYASQQERHDYLGAALGLRRYRTLSLPPEVVAAEGYRDLSVDDFTTRSRAGLVHHLGGVPALVRVEEGPLVSVVVRTKDRPELLNEALASLEASTYRRLQVVLVNDGGRPPEIAPDFSLPVVRIDLEANRGRARAAQAGVEAATGEYVGFLDDDDLVAPEHFAILTGVVSGAGVRVAYSDAAVGVYEIDSREGWRCRSRRLPYSRDFDPDLLLLDNYIPFHTLLIEAGLFAEVGPFDGDLPFFEDWDFLIRLGRTVPFHHLREVTCEYRHFEGGGHHVLGVEPRARHDFLAMKARVLEKHASLLTPSRLSRAVDVLRLAMVEEEEEVRALTGELTRLREAVFDSGQEALSLRRAVAAAQEDASAAWQKTAATEQELVAVRKDVLLEQREAAALRRVVEEGQASYRELDERYHRLNGEATALHDENERAVAELQRLQSVIDDQTGHLERTYGEIERLNRLIREMEGTRAWRMASWWRRRTS